MMSIHPKSISKFNMKVKVKVAQLCSTLWDPMDCSMPGFLPCLSLSPRVCSNSYPLNQWCYLTISSSATLFSFCLQSSPSAFNLLQHQGLFQYIYRCACHCIPLIHVGETQEGWGGTLPNGPSLPLKYHLQLSIKEGCCLRGSPGRGGVAQKRIVSKNVVIMQI